MRLAADVERRRKEEEASLKRQRISDDANFGYSYSNAGSSIAGPSTFPMPLPADFNAAKRRKLQDGSEASATPPLLSSGQPAMAAGLADFDVRSLKPELVLELIMANLQVMTPERVQTAVVVSHYLSALTCGHLLNDFGFFDCFVDCSLESK